MKTLFFLSLFLFSLNRHNNKLNDNLEFVLKSLLNKELEIFFFKIILCLERVHINEKFREPLHW